jgi:protein SCO1/2
MPCLRGIVTLVALSAAACGQAPESRQYEVHGQILRIDTEREEVLVDHDDIEGFMPAMVMPYKVQDVGLLDGKTPGDLITATLVVEEVHAYLSTLTTTGHAPLRTDAAGPVITATDLLSDGDLVPNTPMMDQQGTLMSIESLRGHRVALTFIYTRCPLADFCPLMDQRFAALQEEITQSPELADVRLVSVTLDPEFDTSEVLHAHATALDADPDLWHFVTGDRDEVLGFALRFGVVTESGAPDNLLHNLRTAVIDPEGRLVTAYSGNMWTLDELVADLKAAPAPAH